MQAGLLRKIVTIQQRDVFQDASGAQVSTWSAVAVVRAFIEPISGRKALEAQVINAELTHQITVRYSQVFANPLEVAKLRLLYEGRIFIIHASINNNERNSAIMLLASEGLNDG